MKMFKKVLSLILCLCLFFNSVILNFIPAKAANEAKANDTVTIDGVRIDCNQSLKDNNDSTYTFLMELKTNFGHKNENKDSTLAQNNYFTVKQPGKYVIELWGGNGASGESTSQNAGGTGGNGGHIYGVVDLKAGETIFYSIGGNGNTTINPSSGGGANGPGGNHGDLGNYQVGGGGGYSAVYKFAPNEFEANYLDTNGKLIKNEITESDRLTKYIMIAAGGGGGGAGNGSVFGTQPTGNPDGGNGGSIDSASGSLTGAAYAVEGTFFSGQDGKSSGPYTDYIGHGATNKPGIISESILSVFSGETPNDWGATVNPNSVGGAGGAGQFRGGAGGAGYCGGAGGLMPTFINATNVGGGGGGSSFIAKEVKYSSLTTKESAAIKNANPSLTGGAINISYIDENDKSTFNKVELTTAFSEYIDIVNVNSSSGTYRGRQDEKRTYLTISDLAISNTDVPTYVEVVFTTKPRFGGGNDVPLLMDNTITCNAGSRGSGVINVDPKCCYFNEPVKLTAEGVSHMTNDPNQKFEVTSLYNDKFEIARNNPSQYWPLTFIESIGPYVVKDEQGKVVTGQVNPKTTTNYTVSVDVVPKPCTKAIVGDVNKSVTLTDTATITMLTASSGELNGNVINYSKTLEYDNVKNQYVMSLNIKAGSESLVYDKPAKQIVTANETRYIVGPTSLIKPGYYMIQAWGGNGGNSLGTINQYAAYGGKGGYAGGFIHLETGDELLINVGKQGDHAYNLYAGGFGGQETRVNYNGTTPILVAGGGGGAGGRGGVLQISGPTNGEDVTVMDDVVKNPGEHNGLNGGKGDTAPFGSGAKGGKAGTNYVSGLMSQEYDMLTPEAQQIFDSAKANDYTDADIAKNSSGAVYITCMQLDDTEEIIRENSIDKLNNYSIEAELSDYFIALTDGLEYVNINNTLPLPTCQLDANKLTISGINPTINEKKFGDTGFTKMYLSFDCTVKIPFKTIKGFWGGNDVPILKPTSDTINNPNMKILQGTGFIPVASKNETDYANVNINYAPRLATIDKRYVSGDPVLNKASLYTWSNRPDMTKPLVADFVNISEPAEEALTPSTTTVYPITVGVVPKAEPVKATVIPMSQGKTITRDSTVYVDYQVFYNLNNATTNQPQNPDGKYIVNSDNDLSVVLDGALGYSRPASVKVKVKNQEINNYTYDANAGELVIPKAELVGTINIFADGVPEKYDLSFVYELKPGFGQETKAEKYIAGQTLSNTFADSYAPAAFDGYDFKWDWATKDGMPLNQMPSQNWWVVGKYIPKNYKLTVNYHKDGAVFDKYETNVTYGNTYEIISPSYPGYVPDITALHDVMPAKDVTLDVYYTATFNQLNIIYVKSDTLEEFQRYTKTYQTNEEYNVVSPALDGYTPDTPAVIGKMNDIGVTEYVHYLPVSYKLTFDANGGTCPVNEKDVIFNKQYNYDGKFYQALPTPFRLGYKFVGWYLGDTKIEDTTIVSTPSEHTLVARWISEKYTVKISYQYASGEQAAPDYIVEYDYDTQYSVSSPIIEGYTPSRALIEGTIGAQGVSNIVVYNPNTYKLTINYLKEDGTKAFEPTVEDVIYDTTYTHVTPTLEGYSRSVDLVTGKMGSKDKVVNVYYYLNAPVVSVTVEWSTMEFDYTRGNWNTDTLSYSEDVITPSANESNKITVTNNAQSTVPIVAELEYTTPFSTLSGYFTTTNNSSDPNLWETKILVNEAKTVYYWLKGTIDKDVSGNVNGGECKIIIRGDK